MGCAQNLRQKECLWHDFLGMNLAAEGGGKGVGVAGGEDWGGVEFGGLEAEHVLVGVGGHVEGLGFEGPGVPEYELVAAGDDGEAAAQEGVGDGEALGGGQEVFDFALYCKRPVVGR